MEIDMTNDAAICLCYFADSGIAHILQTHNYFQ